MTVGQSKFRVCSFGDWVVRYQLALEAMRCGTALPEYISSNFLNVLELHYDQNPSNFVSTLEELLLANELDLIKSETKAKTDGASLVRILNRMIRTYKTQKASQLLTMSTMANFNESTEESKADYKQIIRERSRSQEALNENRK